MRSSSNWTLAGTSTANAAKTITKTAPSNQRLIVTSYLVVVRAAAAGADISVAITDDADNVLWQDYIGSGASRGDRCGFTFPEGLEILVSGRASAEVNLVVGAGGAAAITELNLKGRVE
jgi:hypothetical protein